MPSLAVLGAGAVGGTLAAYLSLSGADVTLIARGESLERIRERGAVLMTPGGEKRIRLRCTGDIDERYDAVLYATKSYQLPSAAELVASTPSRDSLHVCLQNGLGNEEVLRKFFGKSGCSTGIIYISAERPRPGVFIHHSGGRLYLGSLWPTEEKMMALRSLSQVINRTPIRCAVSDNIKYWIYRKLLWNASFNPVTALLNLTIEDVVKNPHAMEVVRSAAEEVLSLARSEGIELEEDVVERTIEATVHMGGGPTSMLSDLRAGRRLEIDSILQRPLERGRIRGIEMPTLKTLLRLLISHPGAGEGSPGLNKRKF